MEKIYLSIIIIYSAFKIIPIIWQNAKLLKMLGYKQVFINGIPFIIKKIAPLDFISEQNNFPVTFFNVEKGITLWEQMQSPDDKKLTPKEIEEKLKCMKTICEKSVVSWPKGLKADDFFNMTVKKEVIAMAWKLYISILSYNFPTLKKCYSVKKENVLHIAELCASFGKKPHEHIKSNGQLSELETYMIDEFFYSQLLIKKNTQIEKENKAKQKRAKK